MKKTFTFFVSMICVAALSFAQKAPIDFETGGNGGSNFTWEVSDNGTNPALEVVSAPTGTSVIYVDNVFFSKEANSSVSESDFNRFNIYPNPASSTLNLDLEMNSGSVLGYTITDLNGKVLSNGTAAQASVDVSTWVSGAYFVNVETTKGSYAQKILIK